MIKNPPARAGGARDAGLIPGSGRSPGRRHGNTLQYSCLENPTEEPGGLQFTGSKGDMTEATLYAHNTYLFISYNVH